MSRKIVSSNIFGLCLASVLATSTPAISDELLGISSVVVTDGSGHGVISMLYKITGDFRILRIIKTHKNGKITFPTLWPCEANDLIVAHPEDMLGYYISEKAPCKKNLELITRKRSAPNKKREIPSGVKNIIQTLAKKGVDAITNEEFGVAAMVFNELGARIEKYDTRLAEESYLKSYLYTALVLGIEKPYAQHRNTLIMSDTLKDTIKEFQRKNNLSETGQLDGKVLTKLAGKPFYTIIYKGWRPVEPVEQTKLSFNDFIQRVSASHDIQIKNLGQNLKNAQDIKNHGLAALLSNELAYRFYKKVETRSLAIAAEEFTYKQAGRYLILKDPVRFDPIQERLVISKHFQEAIKKYQIENGVKITGQLDYPTLSKMSGSRVSPYLYGTPQIPSANLSPRQPSEHGAN